MTQEDHDLLIAINTKLDLVLSVSNDHERRLRRLEQWGFGIIGIVAFIQLILLALHNVK